MATASRKEAILGAARAEFAVNGYSGARIERIAASAGTNKQLIFHYFGSKDGLYGAVVSSTFATAPHPRQDVVTPPESLRRSVSDIASWFSGTPGAALLASECGTPGRPVPEDAIRTVSGWIASAMEGIKTVVDDGQRKGYFRDDIDAQSIATIMVGAAVGGALLGGVGHSKAPDEPGTTPEHFLAQIAVEICGWR